jgi:hypothetical protein
MGAHYIPEIMNHTKYSYLHYVAIDPLMVLTIQATSRLTLENIFIATFTSIIGRGCRSP